VYVYGGTGTLDHVGSVEVLTESSGWQVLPTGMFAADSDFASAPLP
jgi:hypothetical protein